MDNGFLGSTYIYVLRDLISTTLRGLYGSCPNALVLAIRRVSQPRLPLRNSTSPSWIKQTRPRLVTAYSSPERFADIPLRQGPKLYLASQDIGGRGTTLLHKDVSSAVNILTFSSNPTQGAPGARWLIFRPEDSSDLCGYLKMKLQLADNVHPIHSQKCFVTDDMLPELASCGIRPYIIQQRVGDAIFIPAGAAHQVRGRDNEAAAEYRFTVA